MIHTYQYRGFDIAVGIETDFSWKGVRGASATVGYVAIELPSNVRFCPVYRAAATSFFMCSCIRR
jgi:hypothetical protein